MNADRLRVLVVGHTYMVGVNQAKLHAIANSGEVEIGLLVPSYWESSEWRRRFLLESPYSSFRIFAAPVWFGGRSGAYLYPPWAVYRAISKFRPDIIHVEQEAFSLSAFEMAVYAIIAQKPLTLFCWENMDRHISVLRQLTRRIVLHAVAYCFPGNQDAANLLRRWGYRGPYEVIPQLGVDTDLFYPSKQSNDGFTIGFVGRLVYEKGVDLILSASRFLGEKHYMFHIILCGTGSYEADLRREAKNLGVSHIITWRGTVHHESVPHEMKQFDVLVLPSRTVKTWKEQFGHVLIEAMSMGIPVIGSTCGEIPNVIGRNDVVFPENDANALAKILERMIRDPTWIEELRQYGITRVEKNFTHRRIAERLIDFWSRIVNPAVYKDSL
jgi:glycosyltransferase involved in cell wall biosynthesis